MADLVTIKNWFKTGLKPTEVQFGVVFDSFRHKDDEIQVAEIVGLDNLFQQKTDQSVFDNYVSSLKSISTIDGLQSVLDTKYDSSNAYTKSQVDDNIVVAKNEVIAQLLDNPDATTNSISEILNLMSNADASLTSSVAEKVSYIVAQSLTSAQKNIAQTNIGVEYFAATNVENNFSVDQTFAGKVILTAGDLILPLNKGIVGLQSGSNRDLLKVNTNNDLEIGSTASNNNTYFKQTGFYHFGGFVGLGIAPLQKLHVDGHILVENNKEVRMMNTNGVSQHTVMKLDASNNLLLGGSYSGNTEFLGAGYNSRGRIKGDNGTWEFDTRVLFKGDVDLSNGHVSIPDYGANQNALYVGSGNDLSIYHDGSDNWLQSNKGSIVHYMSATDKRHAFFVGAQERFKVENSLVTSNVAFKVVGASGGQGEIYISDIDNGTASSKSLLLTQSGVDSFIYNRNSNGILNFGTNDDADMVQILATGKLNARFGLNVLTTDADRTINFRANNGEARFGFYTGGTGNDPYLQMYRSDGTTVGAQIHSNGSSFVTGVLKVNHATDGSNVGIWNYGIEFDRADNYLRPSTDGDKNLYIGSTVSGVLDWNEIRLFASNKILADVGTGIFEVKSDSDAPLRVIGGNDSLSGIGFNGVSGTMGYIYYDSSAKEFQLTEKLTALKAITATNFVGNWNGKTVSDFDKYSHFNLKTEGVQRKTIGSNEDIDFVSEDGLLAISYGAGGKVKFEFNELSYNSLIDKPSIPTTTASLANTANFVSSTGSPNTITNVWSGTQAQYDAIPTKDNNTFYFTE